MDSAAQGVYFRLGIPSPFQWPGDGNHKRSVSDDGVATVLILVYGASTSLGMYAAHWFVGGLSPPGREKDLLDGARGEIQHVEC